ncbi:MAG: SpoIIE family protein phosphatase [Chloroflexi bacterium]|nr:SpoIIE family protein phosphatase [Chloroflexota bacterium]
MSDTLAVAVRNARLFEAERRRRRLAEILREVSAALTSTLHLDDVLDLILSGLARVVSYDAASILLINDLGELILRAMRGAPDADAKAALGRALDVRLFPPGASFPATISFGDVDHRGAYHDLLALPEPHACLGAVLALRGEHLGYLVVDRAGPSHFPAEEVELITAFASQAAVAIENARLYTAQREQTWVSTALLQVAEATARATELAEVFQTVARLTPMLVGVDRCAVLLAEGDKFVLRAYQAVAARDDFREAGPHEFKPLEWPRFVEMLGAHEPVVMEPEDALPAPFRDLFVGVTILLPLLAKGRVEGALMVGQAPGETPFTTHRVRLLTGIANQAALAIESAMLYQSQQEEAWVSTALLQVAQAVAEQPTLEAGLETVARLTPMLVGVEKVAIYQWDEAAQVFRPSQIVGLGPAASLHLVATASDLGFKGDEHAAPAYAFTLPEHLAQAFDAEVGMIWPLRARGDLLGALVVAHAQADALGRRLSILNGIAHQLSLAMDVAARAREVALQQRMEREMEVGRDIQASFLPEACPQFPGWEVCSFWRAARQVGGDFYDFIPLRAHGEEGERWGIVIADVADKGVPAALFMALSRTLLRSVAIGRTSPAATLERVNQLILADAHTDLFVTVFYAVWEPATGRFSYAVGGHNPPVWISRAGEVRLLRGKGIPLGVLEDAHYEEH